MKNIKDDSHESNSSDKNLMRQVFISILFSFVIPVVLVLMLSFTSISDTDHYNNVNIHTSASHDNSNMNPNFSLPLQKQQQQDQQQTRQTGNQLNSPISPVKAQIASISIDGSMISTQNQANSKPDEQTRQFYSGGGMRSDKSKELLDKQNKIIDRQKIVTLQNPEDIKGWLQLAQAQMKLNEVRLTSTTHNLDYIESFRRVLEILSRNIHHMQEKYPGSDQLHEIILVKCRTLLNMARGYSKAVILEKSYKLYSEVLRNDCPSVDIGVALQSRCRNLIAVGDYAAAYRDAMMLFDDVNKSLSMIESKLSLEFDLIQSILLGDESVVQDGWSWLLKYTDKYIPILEDRLSRASDDVMEVRSVEKAALKSLSYAHRALSYYYDKKTNDVDKAWHHLKVANDLKKRFTVETGILSKTGMEQVEYRMNLFSKSFIEKTSSFGTMTKTPVFIIGYNRSGTTLLESIFGAHKAVGCLGEQSVFTDTMFYFSPDVNSSYQNSLMELDKVVNHYSKLVLSGMQSRWATMKNRNLSTENDVVRLIDKNNSNFHFIPYINLLFPEAVIICMVRNPMDVLLSNYQTDLNFSPGMDIQHSDATSNFDELSRSYKLFRKLIRQWDKVLPGRITYVRYEDLVHDTEGVAKAMMNKLEIEWDPSVLEFHEKARTILTPSASQVRQGIYTYAVEKWRKYETYLLPLKEMIGDDAIWEQETTLPDYHNTNLLYMHNL